MLEKHNCLILNSSNFLKLRYREESRKKYLSDIIQNNDDTETFCLVMADEENNC